MPQQTPFVAEKCVELLSAAVPRLAVIRHSDPWHGVHARGELDATATVKYIYLLPATGARVGLHLYPADTLTQARALYGEQARLKRLLDMRSNGWSIGPNFHFGFMTKGLTWTHTTLDTDTYVAYWAERIEQLGALRRDDWRQELDRLRRDGIVNDDDVEQFQRDFTNTDRNHATPRPGLRLERAWDLTDALKPDFPVELRTTLQNVLRALGEHLAFAEVN
jgi:hypothetical protein